MIIISNLSNKKNGNSYSFSDVDLSFNQIKVSNNQKNANVVPGNDVVISVDEQAILNSINNILTQKRYTDPKFNLNLPGFIGQPMTTGNANTLGNAIQKAISLYEPRVTIQNIFVAPDYDNDYYAVAIILLMPNFNNKQLVINSSFTNNGNFTIYYK